MAASSRRAAVERRKYERDRDRQILPRCATARRGEHLGREQARGELAAGCGAAVER